MSCIVHYKQFNEYRCGEHFVLRVLYYDALLSLINKLVRCIFWGMEVMSRLSSKHVLGLFLVAAAVARV